MEIPMRPWTEEFPSGMIDPDMVMLRHADNFAGILKTFKKISDRPIRDGHSESALERLGARIDVDHEDLLGMLAVYPPLHTEHSSQVANYADALCEYAGYVMDDSVRPERPPIEIDCTFSPIPYSMWMKSRDYTVDGAEGITVVARHTPSGRVRIYIDDAENNPHGRTLILNSVDYTALEERGRFGTIFDALPVSGS